MGDQEVIECPGPGVVGVGGPKLEPTKMVDAVEASPDVPITILCGAKCNLEQLFYLYDIGRGNIDKVDIERWRATFALAASTGGVWAAIAGSDMQALAVFWRTKNPHVDLKREVPRFDAAGNFVYVGWFWSLGDYANRVIDYVSKNVDGAEFVAWHDQRSKKKKDKRGQLYVLELPKPPVTLAKVLGIGSGKAAANG